MKWYNNKKVVRFKNKMKKILSVIGDIILLLILCDVIVLFFALLQIALEGRTGEWNGFWMTQARFLLGLLK